MLTDDFCFVIMPFGTKGAYGIEGTEGEKEANRIYDCIKSSVREINKQLGTTLTCERADDPAERGYVDKQIYEKLDQAKVVIADLTGNNPNVYYELGVRLTLRDRNTLILTQDRSEISFDLGHVRSKEYKSDNLGQLRSFLLLQLEDMLQSGTEHSIESPVFTFLPNRHPFSVPEGIQKLWVPFSLSDTRILLGQHPRAPAGETTGAMGTGDAIALGEVISILTILGADYEVVPDAKDTDLVNHNLVLIGGPGSNQTTKLISQRMKLPIWFKAKTGLLASFEPVIYDSIGETEFTTVRDQDGRIETDVGLIVYAKNPFDTNKQLLILAGAWGAGTAGAARAVIRQSETASRLFELQKAEAVVSVPVVHGVAQFPNLVMCRGLNYTEAEV